MPSREELTLAWGDTILRSLSGMPKAFFRGGRFTAVEDGAAVFAVPPTMPLAKCEAHRSAVEQALAQHFGRAVPIRLVVDTDMPVPPPAAAPTGEPEEEHVDLSELVDAPAEPVRSAAERLTDAFPGAAVIEGGTP